MMYGYVNKNITSEVDNLEGPARSIFSAVSVIIAILALLGNSLIIAAYLKYRNLRDSTTSFIINLGFTDLITGIALLFFALAINVTNILQNNYFACLVAYRVPTYLTMVSQSLILVTTLERYMGICRREDYTKVMTTRKRIGLILSAWLLPLPLSLLPFFGYNYWEDIGCHFPQLLPKWLLLLRSLLICFQTIVIMALYSRILIKAREFHHRIRPVPLQGINASTVRYKQIQRSLRNGKITGLVTIIFIATFLPYYLALFCYCIEDVELPFGIIRVTQLVGLSNSMMNPFLYAWQRKDIRNRLTQMLRCNGGMQIRNQGTDLRDFRMKNTMNTQNFWISSDEMSRHQLNMNETLSCRNRNLDISQNIRSKGTSSIKEQVTKL